MAKVLRREVMEDTGRSHLKDRVLDILTNLRLENDILNESKTQARRYKTTITPWQPPNVKADNKRLT
jgi:hypothetical protein